jgi:hypothetical protein
MLDNFALFKEEKNSDREIAYGDFDSDQIDEGTGEL